MIGQEIYSYHTPTCYWTKHYLESQPTCPPPSQHHRTRSRCSSSKRRSQICKYWSHTVYLHTEQGGKKHPCLKDRSLSKHALAVNKRIRLCNHESNEQKRTFKVSAVSTAVWILTSRGWAARIKASMRCWTMKMQRSVKILSLVKRMVIVPALPSHWGHGSEQRYWYWEADDRLHCWRWTVPWQVVAFHNCGLIGVDLQVYETDSKAL